MRYVILIVLQFMVLAGFAQQIPISQYMHHGLPLNPAIAGSVGAMSISATSREQWTGFEGAPSTQIISAHSPFFSDTFSAVVLITNDRIGVTRTTTSTLMGSYRLKVLTGNLHFGLRGGIEQAHNSWSEVRTTDNQDILFANDDRSVLPVIGTGVYYYNSTFYCSFSAPSLLNKVYRDGGYVAEFDILKIRPYFNTGLNLQINDAWMLRPSTLIYKNQSDYVKMDINMLLAYNKQIEFGLSSRSTETFVGMLRYWVKPQFSIAYSYDMERVALSKYSRGSHELTLRYDMIYNRQINNPRFF
ncbi:MAG: PorP/SprF family type IX secretion system membrane protein [Flavobacteriales bacterium]|nr:PorP/SprF family type IX secretion system membrane protein [Flavobacteriales bacterium]